MHHLVKLFLELSTRLRNSLFWFILALRSCRDGCLKSSCYICIWIYAMLAHDYPNRIDKIKLVGSSNHAYSMTSNTLLTGLLFRQIFTVVLLISKYFSGTVFMVSEKALSYQSHNQTTEIKVAIHIITTLPVHSDPRIWILLWVWEPV